MPHLPWLFAPLILATTARGVHGARLTAGPPLGVEAPGDVLQAVPPDLLPLELARHVLSLVPGEIQVVWCSGGPQMSLARPCSEAAPLHLAGHDGGTYDVKFFPLGDRLVTSGYSGSAIWDTQSGRVLHKLWHEPERPPIVEVQVFPAGDRLVSLGTDRTAIIWDARSGTVLRRLNLSRFGFAEHVRIARDGRKLVTGGSRSRLSPVVVWEVSTGRPLHVLRQPHGYIRLLELAPCGVKLVTVPRDMFFLWNVERGRLEGDSGVFGAYVFGIAVTEGAAKVFASTDEHIVIWSLRGGMRRISFEPSPGAAVAQFSVLSRGERLVTIKSMEAKVWDVESGMQLRTLDVGGGDWGAHVEQVVASPGGEVVAVCGKREQRAPHSMGWSMGRSWMTVWDTSTGRRVYDDEQRGDIWTCKIDVAMTPSALHSFLG